MRKPREHGWLDAEGVTHHIDTRQTQAWNPDYRRASCGVHLYGARRVRIDGVDCMTCIVLAARRDRLPKRPAPMANVISWDTPDGIRHKLHADPRRADAWRAQCGASIRRALPSNYPANCVACVSTIEW